VNNELEKSSRDVMEVLSRHLPRSADQNHEEHVKASTFQALQLHQVARFDIIIIIIQG
jgi:hypothetical protein